MDDPPSAQAGPSTAYGSAEDAILSSVVGSTARLSLSNVEQEDRGEDKDKDGRDNGRWVYREFAGEERDMGDIMSLCQQDLSEPYNAYTFRYFFQDWPHLSFLVYDSCTKTGPERAIGCIVCKQEDHRGSKRGYIGMLSVDKGYRRRGIALSLVKRAVQAMARAGVDEVVLETEFDNASSLALYERLGFIREKKLYRFYTNDKDAYRLILPLPKRDPQSGSGTGETPKQNGQGQGLSARHTGPPPEWEGLYT